MATSANAKIQVEMGQEAVALAAMTDSGDNQHFTMSGVDIYSGKSGYAPNVKPNGVASGRTLISTNTSTNTVTVASCTCYLAGVLTTVAAADITVTRPDGDSVLAGTGDHIINAITINSSGEYAAVVGNEGASFIATRDGDGGPPLVPVGSIEIGWVKLDSTGDAVVTASEIFQNSDTYTERYDFPGWEVNNIGDGKKASTSAAENAHVKFDSALDTRHTGSVPKAVYFSGYEPAFSDQSKTMNFVPVENSASVSSTQVYGNKTIGSTSKSLGTGSFTALLNDGVNDGLVAEKDEILTNKFFPDADLSAYILTQGTHTLARTFPVDNQNQATVNIAAEQISSEFSS